MVWALPSWRKPGRAITVCTSATSPLEELLPGYDVNRYSLSIRSEIQKGYFVMVKGMPSWSGTVGFCFCMALPIFLFRSTIGAWYFGVHRMRCDGSSFMWHQPCQCCKYTTLLDIKKRMCYKKLLTHVESQCQCNEC